MITDAFTATVAARRSLLQARSRPLWQSLGASSRKRAAGRRRRGPRRRPPSAMGQGDASTVVVGVRADFGLPCLRSRGHLGDDFGDEARLRELPAELRDVLSASEWASVLDALDAADGECLGSAAAAALVAPVVGPAQRPTGASRASRRGSTIASRAGASGSGAATSTRCPRRRAAGAAAAGATRRWARRAAAPSRGGAPACPRRATAWRSRSRRRGARASCPRSAAETAARRRPPARRFLPSGRAASRAPSSARRERATRPKIGRNDPDATDLGSLEVPSARRGSPAPAQVIGVARSHSASAPDDIFALIAGERSYELVAPPERTL